MKKNIVVIIISLFIYAPLHACDICGCGVGSYYLGILPEFNKRFVGLRYQHKNLTTHLGPNLEKSALTTEETYQSAELWGGWNIGAKFRVIAFVPYNFNRKKAQLDNAYESGLGDIAFMGYYKVFDNKTTLNDKLLVQSLWFGAGIKTPTGNYVPADNNALEQSPNNFQLGTASTDFTLNAAYDVRLMDFGINTNVNYKINTENKHDYRYGNKFTINGLAYYKIKLSDKFTVAPNTGVLYETSAKDVEKNKYDVEISGGYSSSGIIGIEASLKKVSFGANYQNVFSQHLANGRAKAGDRFLMHMSLAF